MEMKYNSLVSQILGVINGIPIIGNPHIREPILLLPEKMIERIKKGHCTVDEEIAIEKFLKVNTSPIDNYPPGYQNELD